MSNENLENNNGSPKNENTEKKINIVLKEDKLSIIGQDIDLIFPELGETYGKTIKQLDLGYNHIT